MNCKKTGLYRLSHLLTLKIAGLHVCPNVDNLPPNCMNSVKRTLGKSGNFDVDETFIEKQNHMITGFPYYTKLTDINIILLASLRKDFSSSSPICLVGHSILLT